MEAYFLWASVGILAFFVVIGLLCGLVRGVKRSSLHLIFFVISIVVAFFITKVVTSAVLGATITVNGEVLTINEFILKIAGDQFDLNSYATAAAFIEKLPLAIVSPIMFILLCLACYIVFDIIYLIVARVAFGRKKKDFQEHKPHRLLGGVFGMVEGFLFLFLLFAPLTALTKTYSELTYVEQAQAQVLMMENEEDVEGHLQTIPEMINQNLPTQVNEAITAYNNSILGKVCGAGGLDKALFDGLSSFKLNGETIRFRSEVLNLAETYNNFVVVYNNYIDKNFDDIDLTKIKANIETFLNNGIFKTVVADTVRDLVVNFEVSTDPENESTIGEKFLIQLKTKFSEEDFNPAEYLKQDILKMFEIVEELTNGDLLSQIQETDQSTSAILEVVSENTEFVENVVGKVFELNIINDAFPAVVDYLQDTVFTMLDEAIAGVTGVEQKTDLTSLEETKLEVVKAVLKILSFALDMQDGQELDVANIGKVLDALKDNAKSHSTDGKYDGVFNETFVNLIWYLTGDSIDGRNFGAAETIEYASQIKTYLGVEEVSKYYEISYEDALKGIQDVINLAKQFENIDADNIESLVENIVDVFENMDDEEIINLLDTAEQILGDVDLVPEDLKSQALSKIEELQNLEEGGISPAVAARLKQLLGLDANSVNP